MVQLAKVSTAGESRLKLFTCKSLSLPSAQTGARSRREWQASYKKKHWQWSESTDCPLSKSTGQGQRPFRWLENPKRCSEELDTIGLLLF